MKRVPLAALPTPVVAADRLGAALGLAPGALLIKHDDLTGLAGGGNKARKLEYLCGDALAQGADVLVTGGARQSNHVRMTAAAANRIGLGCSLVLSSNEPAVATGNLVLDYLLEPDFVWVGDLDYYAVEAAISEQGTRLEAEGRRPYVMPIGGASTVGALGYVRAAEELRSQVPDVDLVVVASGSGGTHAGLVAGLGDHALVLGVDVGARPDLDEQVPAKAVAAAELAGLAPPVGTVQVDHDRIGDGYAEPTGECREALRLAATLEGVILDPVYTGKAMAALIAAARDGGLQDRRRIVFVHTGGTPALFTSRYSEWVRPPGSQPAVAG